MLDLGKLTQKTLKSIDSLSEKSLDSLFSNSSSIETLNEPPTPNFRNTKPKLQPIKPNKFLSVNIPNSPITSLITPQTHNKLFQPPLSSMLASPVKAAIPPQIPVPPSLTKTNIISPLKKRPLNKGKFDTSHHIPSPIPNNSIDETMITKLLTKTRYDQGEWPKLYDTKLVKLNKASERNIINISRMTLQLLIDNGTILKSYPRLNDWLVTIVKDIYADIFVVANLWFLWYLDRYDYPDDLDYADQLMKRRSFSLKIPEENSCEYHYLFNIYILLRRKALREVFDHQIDGDIKPSDNLTLTIWNEICMPLLVNFTKELLQGRIKRPQI